VGQNKPPKWAKPSCQTHQIAFVPGEHVIGDAVYLDRLYLMRLGAEPLLQEADLRTVVADRDVVLGRGLLQEDVEGRGKADVTLTPSLRNWNLLAAGCNTRLATCT
jgi:hypothetical protein